ncbi:DNA cytosine methyltransferase [Listeria innocua]|uniref:DNA cytosine methyltransferase n=1 Tax=Listeria innocua TaxID=1642 RepID=UPI00086C25C9|nr:DNA (cytosine-5-)-methyltransferase [Listeria innocua]OEO39026.1 DNA (cytosine-5-)-methyltransferase [Listeria monocytogenes]MBC1439492.1 DNA cytosine methyltransferase [Listeria innocua]MDG0896924.1 DNA (cytosine-5-)-methyltransferase [Listeria innocua]MDH4593634.1 DNA (cytosine-5-)-methyltransferase [Listeria innocua]UVW26634.1 DNA cytosine methyltransferase [Listeria innocua]
MIFRTGELFAGPGGGAYAAMTSQLVDEQGEKWGFTHAWANEYDPDTVETYKLNILNDPNATSVYCKDVRKFDLHDRAILGDIDALIFGFPCNDYSLVGEKKGLDGDFGPLYKFGVEALREFQPSVFIAENVGGLSSANEGEAFIQIVRELQATGYTLTPNFYKFEQYGVPQARHRIIIVGIRNDLAENGVEFRVPAPTTPEIEQYVTSSQAILNPPIPEDAFNHELTRHNPRTVTMLSYIPEGGNAWVENIPNEFRLNVKGARLSNIYKRLNRNAPSYTVTGSGGGGTHMYHWTDNRALTNRERARLQTFPDHYHFQGGKESVRKQIGMAIPPEGIRHIMMAILRTFAGIEYESVEPTIKLQPAILLKEKGEVVANLVRN